MSRHQPLDPGHDQRPSRRHSPDRSAEFATATASLMSGTLLLQQGFGFAIHWRGQQLRAALAAWSYDRAARRRSAVLDTAPEVLLQAALDTGATDLLREPGRHLGTRAHRRVGRAPPSTSEIARRQPRWPTTGDSRR